MSINPPPPQYKGADLDPAKGPGLGCFYVQLAILAVFVVLTPIGALNDWPVWLTIAMFAVILVLLLFVGQTAIFLLRLVTAERRGRRRPVASRTPTVGELEARESGESSESGEPGERPPTSRSGEGGQGQPGDSDGPGGSGQPDDHLAE